MKNNSVILTLLCFAFTYSLFAQSPGGVGKTDMSLWVRGDYGVSNSGTLTWSDDSGLGNNAFQPTAGAQAAQSSTMNFNSTFTFDGNSDRFAIANKSYPANESISQLYTFVVYKTDFNNTSYSTNWSFLDFDRSETFNFYVHGNGRLAMSYQSGGTRDLVANTTSNDNNAHIGTFIFNNAVTDESIMRLDGNIDYEEDITSSNIVTLSNRFGFIGDGSEAGAENGGANNIYYDGEIAEIIFYEQNALSAADIQKIESYLAVKYGITLNQSFGSYVNASNVTIWNNLTYWNDIAGIINDSSTGALNQRVTQSNSQDQLTVATTNDYTTLNNDVSRADLPLGSSLLFGNNGNNTGVQVFDAGSSDLILNRKWYFTEVGETGSVYLAMPKSVFNGESIDLIVSTDDTFDNSDTRIPMSSDATHFYTSVNVNDGDRVSFIIKDNFAPGGVLGASLWYKANNGVTLSGGNVEAVADQTGNANNLLQPSAANRPSNADLMNFNPTFTFDGSSDRLPIENKNYTSADNLNQVYVWTVYATTFSDASQASNSYDTTNWAFLDFDRSEWFNTSVSGDGRLGFYYHPSGSTIVDNKAPTITNNGIPHIGGFTFDLNDVNETTIRLNGAVDLVADRTNLALNSNNTRYGFVGDGSEATSFNGTSNNSYYSGDISEVIYFENQVLSTAKIETIESYLAIKYGITLNQTTPTNYYASDWDGTSGTVIWNAADNSAYNNDIAGIGLDERSDLNQRISKSQNTDALVTFALDNDFVSANNASSRTTDHATNLSFMSWGNNNEPMTWSATGATDCSNKRLNRIWRIDETGSVGTVYISVPDDSSTEPSKLPTEDTSLYLITKQSDSDFTTGATMTELTLNGTRWELPAGIDFADGTYFTFETLRATKTAVGSDWSTAADWSPASVPTAIDNVVIPTGIDMAIAASSVVEANQIKVEAGASLTVNTGAALTANCDVVLESVSTSYSSLILDGSILGAVIYNRHINAAATSGNATTFNDLVSAPLTGETFGNFRAANSNILSGTIGGNPAFLFGPYNSTTNVYVNYGPGDDASTLDAGVGYRTGSTDNGTYAFSGTVETSTVTVPVVTSSNLNWNLIGNPYPSYLSVQDFLNDTNNQTIMNNGTYYGIYGYDGAAHDGWTIYNLANTTSTTAITPGQGFFIATEPNVSGSIRFEPVMRTTGNTDDFIVGRSASSPLTYLKLKTNTSDDLYKTAFYFNSNSTLGLDVGYDAVTWHENISDFALYSNLVEGNEGQPYAIQSLHDSDLNNVTIPLGVHSNAGESLTFSIDESTLPMHTEVYLQDALLNTFTLLTTADYTITPANDLSGTGRFYLNISNTALSTNDLTKDALEIYNDPNSTVLVVNGVLQSKASIALIDMQGRVVTTQDLSLHVNSQSVAFKTISAGVYIAKIYGDNYSKSQKVMFYNK
ncbi:T9SS type A sorting domain-containing protein [Winogradskyella eckloniae]|uniref:T9SS type A sorting domain-containing protein n=1 Tax=Winogradskyella eckloniae TaxID=1089306 RepID=UPI001565D4ED|nr:T9SS type A sorting domain-containing protein [Winogradskyella eckloniae]NRD19609.1 T9SS type A sorting domain-containing protein [Winogradskyella eckloniae]